MDSVSIYIIHVTKIKKRSIKLKFLISPTFYIKLKFNIIIVIIIFVSSWCTLLCLFLFFISFTFFLRWTTFLRTFLSTFKRTPLFPFFFATTKFCPVSFFSFERGGEFFAQAPPWAPPTVLAWLTIINLIIINL